MKSNIAAVNRLETAQKNQNLDKLEDFVLRERLVDEKGWHHNVCHADEVHYIYITYVRVIEIINLKVIPPAHATT